MGAIGSTIAFIHGKKEIFQEIKNNPQRHIIFFLLGIIIFSAEEVLDMPEEIEEVTICRDGKEFSKITKLTREQSETIKALKVMGVFQSL
ncbi:MAG: hypothetical protein HY929_00325 [Euryarchaeota archaeon]|nr:hypothetical protein [Euryarchaeota archaeon]